MTASTVRYQTDAAPDASPKSVIEVFVELADTLVEDYDLQDFLYGLLRHCTRLFDAPAAGIMLTTPRGGVELAASSSTRRSTSSCTSCRRRPVPAWSA